MTPAGCEADTLRLLAEMPFLDRLELAALSGWSRGAVYGAIRKLEARGMVDAIPHASPLAAPTRRHCLTAAGVHLLAELEGIAVDELLRNRPVSERWRRLMLERLDAAAVIYRLAQALDQAAHALRFRWFRALPVDAAVALPDGRVLGVVRQGRTADRTAFAKRLWRLRVGYRPSAVLMLAPDEVRLRHARRLLAAAPFPAYLALESDAASAGAAAPIWRTPSGAAVMGLQTALEHTGPRAAWPVEEPLARAALPAPLREDGGYDWMLPALLKPTEKQALDLLSDWPWLAPAHLGMLLGVKRSRLSQVTLRLQDLGLMASADVPGQRRLAVADKGLAYLARRDRAATGAAKARWSVSPVAGEAGPEWRGVPGRRSRQLLRNIEHTGAVHDFIAALARQARSRSREIMQLDPPLRASRYFRHDGRLRSIHPDAFGMLRRGNNAWPFFLEWERRAVRPATMAARIAPYLRYSSSQRPTDDHRAHPLVLVVFDDPIAVTHFLAVAQDAIDRARVRVPLLASHRELVQQAGPLGRAWLSPDRFEPDFAFQSR